jgi:protein-S-isoprenylcysteine O-methyltransferase Ste14
MNILGIGPVLAVAGFLGACVIFYIENFFNCHFRLSGVPAEILFGAGVLLLVAGVVLWLVSILQIRRGFPQGKLLTCGAYSLCRNPLYAAFIIFIAPGIACVLDNLLLLLVAWIMYMAFVLLIKKEESFLLEKFGAEYEKYAKTVPLLLPDIYTMIFGAKRGEK